MAQPKTSNETQPADCCGNCRYFSMTEAPARLPAETVAATLLPPTVQGCCLRYPPAVFPVGQKNMIAGAELSMASISVRAVVGADDWCGEFAVHSPLLQ